MNEALAQLSNDLQALTKAVQDLPANIAAQQTSAIATIQAASTTVQNATAAVIAAAPPVVAPSA